MVSELFLTMVRRLIFCFLVILLVATASHAQNAGNVGIYTREVSVFTAQASGTSSVILPDFGFASQSLFVCNTGFTGTIDLEWSPPIPGSQTFGPFYPLILATYSNDSACHTLQLGGYFPNLRSTMTRGAGLLSAWYTASAAPISYFPSGLGSNGASSPIQCDQSVGASVIGTGSYASLIASNTRGFAICGFTVSFNGATSTQTDGVQVGFGSASGCSGAVYEWFITTTPNTPQVISVGGGLGAMFQVPFSGSGICVGNHSGASIEISLWYALL
jgi:hypothetical protein